MKLMEDMSDPRLLYGKWILFLLGGVISCALILMECPRVKVALLLALAIWCFARAYYFAFYVIEHYIDPNYKFSSLWAFACYLCGRSKRKSTDESGGMGEH
jgi:hypothetical protein